MVVSLSLFVVLATPFFSHTVDDAYISFRYADNWIEGHGLVFNPGERVEGYTNFLWIVLLAPFIALSVDPATAAAVIGLLAAAGTLVIVVRMSPRPEHNPGIVWIAPLLLASSPPFLVWATGGLETPLYTLLITAAAAGIARSAPRGTLPISSAILAGLAALTRPEGVLVAAVLGLAALLLHHEQANFHRHFLNWCGAFLAIFLPYFLWRLLYYGRPLPNTFYAKVGSDPEQVQRGFAYLLDFFLVCGFWLLLPLVGLIWARRRSWVIVFGGLSLTLGLSVVALGGDGLPMFRFFVPVLPFFFLLLAEGTTGALERFRPTRVVKPLAVVAGIILCTLSARAAFSGPARDYVRQDVAEVEAWTAIGLWFRDNAAPGASIAVVPAGAIPWFSGLPAIDMLGLNDATIARRDTPRLGAGQAGHEKYDVDYVLSRKPTYIVAGVYKLQRRPGPPRAMVHPFYPAETELLRAPGLWREYRLRSAVTEGGHFAYFARNDAGARPPSGNDPLP
jgi:hypothetical protein